MASPSLPQQTKGAPVIRRFVMPLVAFAIIAAVLIAASPADAGTRRMALGVWIPVGNRDMSVYEDFAQQVGRTPAVVTMSVQWGHPDRKWFPTSLAKRAKRNGSAVMITWTPTALPLSKETGKYARFKNIVKGKHDGYIRKFAKQVKRSKVTVWMRPFHEVNATFFPWSAGWGKFYDPATGARTKKNDNNAKLYKKAFARIVNIFKKKKVTNVRWLWTVAKKSCSGGCNPYAKWEPKEKLYHYAGFSTFNWGGFNGRTWNTFPAGLNQPMRNFKKITKKPIVIAELGSTHKLGPNGQTKSNWLSSGYPAVHKKYRNVIATIYQHVDFTGASHGHPNWNLNDPPGSINAYKNLLKKKKFKGKVNKKGKVY